MFILQENICTRREALQTLWLPPVIPSTISSLDTVISNLPIHLSKALNHTVRSFTTVQYSIQSLRFSSVAQSCPILCSPMDGSTPGFPVHHQLPELTQMPVHRDSDAIQPSHPSSPSLSPPSPPTFNISQHQGLFKWVSSSHQVAKVLEFQLQDQPFQWIFRTDLL